MVEIKSEENNTVQLPNNIRQVGTPGEKIKIYIEDYVMTYLNQMTGEKPVLQKAALLLGEKVKKESTDIYLTVSTLGESHWPLPASDLPTFPATASGH